MIVTNNVDGAPSAGDVLLGKYRVERVLGRGGMGIVVAAQHLQLDTLVAIKLLLPEISGDDGAVARFTREARAAARIKNEHVARVMDVGHLDDHTPYIVMEYLDGTDLAGWLRQRGPLPPGQAVEFLLQACEAVAEAHHIGIVHRDLKPANLFRITRANGSSLIKVLDFGISKIFEPDGVARQYDLTQSACTMGTPYYMSPEQIRSPRDVDVRSDVWSLGAILFELLTGRVPFTATSLPDLYYAILSQPPPQVRAYRPELPLALDRAIQRCLTKTREERYSSVTELAAALAPFAPKEGSSPPARMPETALPQSLVSSSTAALELGGQESSPRNAASEPPKKTGSLPPKARFVFGGIVTLICLSALALLVAKRERLRRYESNPPSIAQRPAVPSAVASMRFTTTEPITLPRAGRDTRDPGEIAGAIPIANVAASTATATSLPMAPPARRAVGSRRIQPTVNASRGGIEEHSVPRGSVYDDME